MLTTERRLNVEDEYLFGWDTTEGIVSVWANRDGRALVWRRVEGKVLCERERFRPWLFATSLGDLKHLGPALLPVTAFGGEDALVNYQELDGEAGSYRYLITARDGRFLERAVLNGAARRQGKRVTNWADIEGDYYRVGPVEQYLMETGRVYFRGLNYEDLHRLQFDLETTAFDPNRGRIFLVAIRDSRGFARTLEASTPGEERELIDELCKIIRERDPDVIENHNIFGFDLPFLEQRAAHLKVPLALGRAGAPVMLEKREETLAVGPEARKRTRYSIAGRELIDTLDAVRRYDFVVRDLTSYRLKEVARYFGIASPERVYIEGSEIFATYQKTPELVVHYAQDDVEEVDGLSRRLLGAPFVLASIAPRRYERLASAGPAMGILEPILVRAYRRNLTALPRQTVASNMHEGGATILLADGIAEQVVKADVASLYPSLMRTFHIGPSCDRLGVLLSVLGRLTDLRLQHKAAARQATPGSLEANHHDATQAAMKILINAAYGYMGAGQMALFADAEAANEVTRRGRELLNQVLDALRERGMALIEADTDGVYFAVPRGWSEEQERALVAEIGAELPAGVRLEYEGRYRAMLSHTVKNYALLTYDQRLIVRGVALRSSRAEPFGERFLRRALLCAMNNDIPGLHEAFEETVESLRARALPATDLGARVRLSKDPTTYQAARSNHPEPQYEALINAGRARWTVGERVRFYRSSSKQYIWLPDEVDEVSAGAAWDEEEEGEERPARNGRPHGRENHDNRDYDVEHYLNVLVTSYAARLRRAFEPGDFAQLFRADGQRGLFDAPIESIEPRWIRCREGA